MLIRKWIKPESREHWLKMRSQDLTSTDMAALFGISPYLTEFELYHRKKSAKVIEIEENERMKWGNRLEDSIARGVADEKGWRDLVPFKDYARVPEFRIGSSFDYYRTEAAALVEIKNVDGIQYARNWIDDGINLEAPPHIELQVQHQMLVAGIQRCYLVALVGGNSLTVIERQFAPAIGNAILKKAQAFWQRIEIGKEPQVDFEKDARFIKELYSHAEPNKMVDATAEIIEQANLYQQVSAMIKELEKSKETHKAKLLTMIGDAEKVKGEGFTISAGMVGPSEYMVKREGYRNFKITFKKQKEGL
jgi:putative phage-type endonuclease